MDFTLRHHFWHSIYKRDWTPSMPLEGINGDWWMRADQKVYSGGARVLTANNKASLDASVSLNCFAVNEFTITGWFKADAVNIEQTIVSDYHSHLTTKRWKIGITAAGNLTFTVGLSTVLNAGAVLANKWYFFAARVNVSDGDIFCSVNDAAESSNTAGITATGDGTLTRFSIGSTIDGTNTLWFGGAVSKVSVWNRALTSAERTFLFNRGNGHLYGEYGEAGTDGSALLTSINSSYNLNEASGTAFDAHGTNDLTPTFVELASNTGFETAGGGGGDVYGSWAESATGGATAIVNETVDVDAGSSAARFDIDAGGGSASLSQTILTVGHRYRATGRVKISDASGSGEGRFEFGSSANYGFSLTTSYATYDSGNVTCAGSGVFALLNVGGDSYGKSLYWDTISVKAVDILCTDGPESDIASDSVGGAHGVLTSFADSEAAWSSDRPSAISSLVDGSLVFDGSDDKVVIPATSALNISGDITISAWLKRGSDAGGGIFFKGTGAVWNYTFYYAAGTLRFYSDGLSPAGFNDGVALPADWCHVAVVRNGTTTTLYVNGTQTGTTTQTGSMGTSGTVIQIGIDALDATLKVAGNMADVRVYNTAKTPSEIAQLAAGTDITSGLAGRWKLDDGQQTGLVDGDTVIRWVSLEGYFRDFIQPTGSKRGRYDASVINGHPAIRFDGLSQLFTCATAFLNGTTGTLIITYRIETALNEYETLVASCDEATTVRQINFYGRGNDANAHLNLQQENNDTGDLLDGNTTVNAGTNYVAVFQSDGSTITARLNGVAQTLNADGGANNGDWFGDVSNKDNVTIGARKKTSEDNFFAGWVAEIYHHPSKLNAASLAKHNIYSTARYNVPT